MRPIPHVASELFSSISQPVSSTMVSVQGYVRSAWLFMRESTDAFVGNQSTL
jgi:hypothetical protein